MKTQLKSGRHLYGRGWLGLIPLVGGFVGCGLIVLGVFKYKDRKLTLIGFAALSFTMLVYGYLVYDLKYSTSTAIAYEKMSQETLNGLPKQIELYKMQYGKYPDSLEQMSENERFLMLVDPLLVRKMDRNAKTLYMYKKIGEKYTIYSVGIDGAPNTSDDLYPKISSNDKLSYGLINVNK